MISKPVFKNFKIALDILDGTIALDNKLSKENHATLIYNINIQPYLLTGEDNVEIHYLISYNGETVKKQIECIYNYNHSPDWTWYYNRETGRFVASNIDLDDYKYQQVDMLQHIF